MKSILIVGFSSKIDKIVVAKGSEMPLLRLGTIDSPFFVFASNAVICALISDSDGRSNRFGYLWINSDSILLGSLLYKIFLLQMCAKSAILCLILSFLSPLTFLFQAKNPGKARNPNIQPEPEPEQPPVKESTRNKNLRLIEKFKQGKISELKMRKMGFLKVNFFQN